MRTPKFLKRLAESVISKFPSKFEPDDKEEPLILQREVGDETEEALSDKDAGNPLPPAEEAKRPPSQKKDTEEEDLSTSTGIRSSIGRWLGWGVAMALIVTWILISSFDGDSDDSLREEIVVATESAEVTNNSDSPSVATDTTYSIIVGKEWSEPVDVPLMKQINWERSGDLAAIEIRNQFGDTKSLPRGPAREHVSFPGRLSTLQFRVTEEEADSVIIQIAISPVR